MICGTRVVKRLLCPCPIRFVSKSWKRIESRVPRAPVLVLQAGTLADPPPETPPPARSSYRPVRTARRSQAPSSKPGARSASCSGRRRPCSRFHCPGKKSIPVYPFFARIYVMYAYVLSMHCCSSVGWTPAWVVNLLTFQSGKLVLDNKFN
jgi:hypothetical protein